MASYDPKTFKLLTFHDAVAKFRDGKDTPRAYLERCLDVIETREPEVQAFVVLNIDGARKAADESGKRYAEGKPLSTIDGMPIGIKDLFETMDMPTQMGSPVWKGWESGRDAAHVRGLRKAGSVVLGKLVTTELGFSFPGKTRNPIDSGRTPGGSSSGSAAAIGAGMLPAAIGSQVVGSVIRPAGYCGNVAIKPTFGALNRGGGHSSLSQSHIGVHAGSIEDAWATCWNIANIAGGDVGHPGLYGALEPAAPAKPARLIQLETAGWAQADEASKEALQGVVAELRKQGVTVIGKADDADVAAYEALSAEALELSIIICMFELRWPLLGYRERGPGMLSDFMLGRLADAEKQTLEDYRDMLARREKIRAAFAALKSKADGFITLSSPGPAPKGLESTGNPSMNAAMSITGAPAWSLPLLAVDGMPLGVQLVGFPHEDAKVTGHARWLMGTYLGA
ncbi:MAG: amidase [Alphaproteobacteria bacterium]|nr:amidase [Alphaproteobacteria bacterium]MBU0798225.1 amidase [Alphaproteobacteria bacterium]MBU0888629.1 amidase [Alphaproteobacteria bacterium]MBU1813637.1 amidase [Alphaproteobacteria bacterium]MBU2091299.1 amidase [Alphaproteobacteria bacterium]